MQTSLGYMVGKFGLLSKEQLNCNLKAKHIQPNKGCYKREASNLNKMSYMWEYTCDAEIKEERLGMARM